MCQTEGTPLGDASNKGLGPKMQNHQLSWWIFILFLENIKIFVYTIYYFKYKVILMETYFSVGEISKLTSIPIEILRYYDKMGLLKSVYINKQNN